LAPRRTAKLLRESPQNGPRFIERSQNRIYVMVGPYECCDTLLTIEPIRHHAIALRKPSSTDDYGRDQGLIKIWRARLPAIQK